MLRWFFGSINHTEFGFDHLGYYQFEGYLTLSLASANTNFKYLSVCHLTREKDFFFPSQSTTPNQCRCPYRTFSIEKNWSKYQEGTQKTIWSYSSVYKQENRGPEKWNDLPNVTQLSGRSGLESESYACWWIVLSTMPHHSPGFRFSSAHYQMLKRGCFCTESVPLFSNCSPSPPPKKFEILELFR